MAPVTLTSDGFHSAAVQDGDAAMASLDRAEVLERETRRGGPRALEAKRLTEAGLRHVDAWTLCSVGDDEQPARETLTGGMEPVARRPPCHVRDQRLAVLEEHALERGTAFTFGLKGRRSDPKRVAGHDADDTVRALLIVRESQTHEPLTADERDFDGRCILGHHL